MRFFKLYILLGCLGLLMSCEEVIDLDLHDAEPKIVIEAEINDLDDNHNQVIYISRTVAFSDERSSDPVTDAQVYIHTGEGGAYQFVQGQVPGEYRSVTVMELKPNVEYVLYVEIDGEIYRAAEIMPEYIDIDSMGAGRERVFDSYVYYGSLQFQDPPNVPNFYKYDVAVNGGAFQFSSVWNDKFNDGLLVTHQINSPERDLSFSDSFQVRRYVVSAAVYRYWNEVQSANPGVAAPANPQSNISSGALGYFSVSSGREYTFSVGEIEMLNNDGDEDEEHPQP